MLELKYTLEDFNEDKIIDKFGMEEGGDADLFLANTCFRRMQKYVPFDTGALSTTVTVKPGSVTYEVPYAHRQYTTNKGNGLRGSHWDARMKSFEKDAIVKELTNFVKQRKGNK